MNHDNTATACTVTLNSRLRNKVLMASSLLQRNRTPPGTMRGETQRRGRCGGCLWGAVTGAGTGAGAGVTALAEGEDVCGGVGTAGVDEAGTCKVTCAKVRKREEEYIDRLQRLVRTR